MNIDLYHLIVLSLYGILLYILPKKSGIPLSFKFTQKSIYLVLASLLLISGLYYLIGGNYVSTKTGINNYLSVQIIGTYIVYALAFAIGEEILFRGYLQGFVESKTKNTFLIIGISSFIFGFCHLLNGVETIGLYSLNWKLSILSGLFGIFLGTIFKITKSLSGPIMLHAIVLVIIQVYIVI